MNSETENPAWNRTLATLALGWLLLLLCFPISHNDIWWHLKSGQWVWQHHSFPDQDPFSYSSPDTRWLKASWLFNMLAWAVYAAAGLKGLIGAKLLVAAATGFLLLRHARRRQMSLTLGIGFLILAFLATRFGWTERPQSCAALLFVAALISLESPPGPWRNLSLLALGLLWSNLNPSAVLLPAFAGAYALGEWFEDRRLDWQPPLLCFAGTLISPQWGADYVDVFKLHHEQAAMIKMVAEWKAPVLAESPALLLLYTLLPFVLWQTWREKKWAAVFVLLPAAWGAWRVGRMLPFFAFSMALFGPALLSPALGGKFKLRLGAVLGVFLAGHAVWISSADRLWGKSLDESQFPIHAAEFLAADRPVGHLGNLYRDGAYLLFRLGPETQVFIDSREIIYPEHVFKTALALESGTQAWKLICRDFKISCMLLPRNSRLFADWAGGKDWTLVYFDKDFAVVASREELGRHQGRWPDYAGLDLPHMALRQPTQQTTLALEGRLASQSPDAEGYYLLGLSDMNEKKWGEAQGALQLSLNLDPDQPAVKELFEKIRRFPTK